MGSTSSAATAISRVLDQFSECLDSESARRVVEFKIDAQTLARVAMLGEKAKEGQLSPEELEECKSYIEVGDMIAILKLKAEQRLASPTGV